MAATTTTRRHQPWHNGSTGKASSMMASSTATTTTTASPSSSKTFSSKTSTTATANGATASGVRPPDPRLSVSLRAFHQIAPRKRPRQEAPSLHGDIFSLLAAAAAAAQPLPVPTQTADSFLPSPPQEKLEPSIFPASCLYDPVSPWGVRGIAYDPALPQWSLPDGMASPPCSSYVCEFVGGQPAAASAPPPWTQRDQTRRKSEEAKKERFFGPGLREIMNMIPSTPSPPILPPSRPTAADSNGYLTDKRFVLAEAVPGLGQHTPQQTPATLATPITPVTPIPAPTLAATTANGKRRRKPSMKAQLLSENGFGNGRQVISTPASAAAPITPYATPIPPPVTPITPPVNGRTAPAAATTNGHGSRCCPMEVPTILHMILDQTTDNLKPQMIDSYASYAPRLCHDHRNKYEHFKALMQSGRSSTGTTTTSHTSHTSHSCNTSASSVLPPSAPPKKKRKSSTNAVPSAPSQQPAQPPPPTHPPYTADPRGIRPAIKAARDDKYRRHMLAEIQQRLTTKHGSDTTHGGVTNRVIQSLLSIARSPNADPSKGPLDVHALTGDEARTMLDAGSPNEPVITEKEQMFRWRPQMRPIAELFRRMENLDRRVSVQVPSRHCMDDSFESRDLIQVRDRFLGPSGCEDKKVPADDDPWNILDLRSPLPAAVLPQFLTNENCQLLPRLRDEVLNPSRAERDTAAREQWNEWRDVLEWVLLSQGGHNTSPHTDSHGLGTWITVQEGLFGFGWLSHPTPEERAAWMANPHGFCGGNWCYMVLEPGQTVFFNSGTVHFVFRLRSEPTLALGGHVLQWSGIERWLQVVAAQMQNPHITNEDMEWSAPKYVRVVARLVEARKQSGRVEEMGGASSVDRLLGLLKDFDDMYIKERPKPKGRPAKATKTKGKKKNVALK